MTTSCIRPAIRAGAAPRALAMGGAPQARRAAEEGGSAEAEPSPPDARHTLPASVTTIQHRAADWTAWEDSEAYDLIIGADVLYADTMHPHLRAIFERNLAPGGTILLSGPFRKESLALLEAMETSAWKVTMNKWTVGITPPERPVGVFELTLPA